MGKLTIASRRKYIIKCNIQQKDVETEKVFEIDPRSSLEQYPSNGVRIVCGYNIPDKLTNCSVEGETSEEFLIQLLIRENK